MSGHTYTHTHTHTYIHTHIHTHTTTTITLAAHAHLGLIGRAEASPPLSVELSEYSLYLFIYL